MAAPVLALSTLNCTLATAAPPLAVALADIVTMPERVALAAGEVIETVGGVVLAAVENVVSGPEALEFFTSVDRTRKW
jgi:hypothetical protein